MNNWTPTTKQVREQFTREEPPRIGTVAEKSRAFDRWLEQVKAEAWDEGFDAGERDAFDLDENPNHECIKNPYRRDKTHE